MQQDPKGDTLEQWRIGRRALAERRYAEGWPLYEVRRQLRWTPPIQASYPEWRGEPLDGKRLMVCAEQGFGDQIMFGRFLPQLEERGAVVGVACHPGFLGRLFRARGAVIAPFYTDRPLPEADYWTYFGSLPYRLGSMPPPPARYLDFPVSSGGGLGVMTRGNPANRIDADRILPPAFAEALNSLGRNLDPEVTGARDFLDTAAVLSSLDLVVTVDTAVAHLAGAMGKPCWVILARAGSDWRWNDGKHSDWYPDFQLWPHPDTSGEDLLQALAERGFGRR